MELNIKTQLETNRAELEMILETARKYDVHKISFEDMSFELFPKPASANQSDVVNSIKEPTQEDLLLWSSPEGMLTSSEIASLSEGDKKEYEKMVREELK